MSALPPTADASSGTGPEALPANVTAPVAARDTEGGNKRKREAVGPEPTIQEVELRLRYAHGDADGHRRATSIKRSQQQEFRSIQEKLRTLEHKHECKELAENAWRNNNGDVRPRLCLCAQTRARRTP